jgi:hypothetical protein
MMAAGRRSGVYDGRINGEGDRGGHHEGDDDGGHPHEGLLTVHPGFHRCATISWSRPPGGSTAEVPLLRRVLLVARRHRLT